MWLLTRIIGCQMSFSRLIVFICVDPVGGHWVDQVKDAVSKVCMLSFDGIVFEIQHFLSISKVSYLLVGPSRSINLIKFKWVSNCIGDPTGKWLLLLKPPSQKLASDEGRNVTEKMTIIIFGNIFHSFIFFGSIVEWTGKKERKNK